MDNGGLAIYGGIIVGFLSAIIIAKIKKLPPYKVLDLASFGFLIGQTIGRFGNFFNQEAFGSETNFILGMMSVNTNYKAVHPCFLYESLWCLSIFIFLHMNGSKWKSKSGLIFWNYLFFYSLGRSFIEILRTDSLMVPNTNVKISILVACLLMILALFQIIRIIKSKNCIF